VIKEQENGRELYFCCKGCQGVYHLLKDEGLDSFYEKLGEKTLAPASEREEINSGLERFDMEGFAKRYIKKTEEGFSEVNLIIEGIHCSACVWLNEKVLYKLSGVVEATINYSNNKAKVVWDCNEVNLSKIIETIQAIGYNAYPYDPKVQEERAIKSRNEYYSRILVAVFATMNIMWIAIAQYAGYFMGMERGHKNILNIAEFVLATPTLFYSGWIFFRGAWFGLKNRFINMDFLVAVGATLAYIYSIYAMVSMSGEVYFDSVTMIITFVLVGKYLEILSKKRAVDTLDKIISSMPTEVIVIKDGVKSFIAVENVEIGDLIELKSGEKVVIDGEIEDDNGIFDESSLTGESKPVIKNRGDEVLSGTVCIDKVVRYRATKRVDESLLHNITQMLSDAVTKKPKIEQLANSISGYFSVVILLIAIVTFFYWLSVDSLENALIIAISVVVIACPCALGLATPMATLVGVSQSAKKGILFKEAVMLETMAKANLLALDKTGTITEGEPRVVSFREKSGFDERVLYRLVESSTHPISRGVKIFLENRYRGIEDIHIDSIEDVRGRGLKGRYKNSVVAGGNLALLKELGIEIGDGIDGIDSEESLFIFVIDGKVVAEFELRDELKYGVKEMVKLLKREGIEVVMLTGDNERVSSKVAKEIGIDMYYSELYPQDKAFLIDRFHNEGFIVVMAGDGINDSIALAKSDIAIAMGNGADIAIEVSDVVLLDNAPKTLKDAFFISKRTFANVKQNLAFSILYNIVAVPMAVVGYVNPLVAALSMSLSSLVVVGNAMRIGAERSIEKIGEESL
jgi:Cu+-exporting ATPase